MSQLVILEGGGGGGKEEVESEWGASVGGRVRSGSNMALRPSQDFLGMMPIVSLCSPPLLTSFNFSTQLPFML